MADPLSLAFAEKHPRDVARLLEREAPETAAEFLESAEMDGTSAIVEMMAPDAAALCLGAMSPDAAKLLVKEMPVTAAIEIFRRADTTTRERLMTGLPEGLRLKIAAGLRQPAGLVGANTDAHVVAIREDATTEDAIKRARTLPERLQKYLYVIDDAGRLAGVVDIRELLLAVPGQQVRNLMKRNVISVPMRAPLEAVQGHPGWRQFPILPVVDRDGRFQGVIRARDLAGSASRQQKRTETMRGLGDAVFALTDVFWSTGADILVSATRLRAETDPTKK